MTVQKPNLATLQDLPSWCNLRGGLDRSACIEIRLAEVRELAGCSSFHAASRQPRFPGSKRRRPAPRSRIAHDTYPLPDEVPAPNAHGRLSSGTVTITADQLHALHATRPARSLAGDMRTSRANVMRERNQGIETSRDQGNPQSTVQNPKSKIHYPCRMTRAQPIVWPPERGLAPNPNRGPNQSRITALPDSWSQTLRIERWRYPTRKLPVYYLVCPAGQVSGDRGQGSGDNPQSPIHNPKFLPPLSTRPAAREHPSTGRCPQRCRKLMMVQCTPAEAHDARLAQLWIRMMEGHPNMRRLLREDEALRGFHVALVARYGPLFEPRVLLCPRCLGVKYGNNPETVRQSWRRRNRRPRVATPGEIELGLERLNEFTATMRAIRTDIAGLRGLEAAMRAYEEAMKHGGHGEGEE